MHIDYSQEALDNLRALPRRFADQIIRKVSRLEHGLAGDIKRLQAADFAHRLRSGNYRILFDVVGDRIIVQSIKNAAKPMISTEKKLTFATQKRRVIKEISRLREEVEDLMDYLDLLEARAKNRGKRTYTTDEVRTQLGLPSR